MLLTRLPPWALAGGQPWGAEAELLAGLIDHVAYLTWVTLRAHGAKGARKPKPVRRPPAIRDVLRASGVEVAPRAPVAPVEAAGRSKAGNWADAARQLAAVKGVIVTEVGAGG